MSRRKSLERAAALRVTRTGETPERALQLIRAMTRRELWYERVLSITHDKLGIVDTFDSDDPYDLKDAAETARKAGTSPLHFVREAFAEDFAEQENDDELRRQSEEEGLAEDEGGEGRD